MRDFYCLITVTMTKIYYKVESCREDVVPRTDDDAIDLARRLYNLGIKDAHVQCPVISGGLDNWLQLFRGEIKAHGITCS